jgi:hypothetical protein
MIFPDKSYNFVAGKEQFIDQMVEYFPKERDAIVKVSGSGETVYQRFHQILYE